MKKGLLALGALFAICLSMLATDMVVKQKNGEIVRFDVSEINEVIFSESNPEDTTVVNASETFLKFRILSDSITAEVIKEDSINESSYLGHDSIIVPQKVRIDGKIYDVTSIGEFAFANNPDLTSFGIPSYITNIGYAAFDGCKNLNVKIDNPENYVQVESYAFRGCKSMEYVNPLFIYFKDTDSTVYVYRDQLCDSYDSITIFPDSVVIPSKVKIDNKVYTVTSVNDRIFGESGNNTIKSVVIPSSVTELMNRTFENCTALTSVSIPSSVTSIWPGAFKGCVNLTPEVLVYDNGTKCYGWVGDKEKCKEVIIPEGVKKIGTSAFEDCVNLTSVVIPSTDTIIGYYAFYNCINLTNVNIPSSVTTIGGFTFSRCTKLDSIKIPDNVTLIGESAFAYCNGLTSVNIPSGINTISIETFSNCSALTNIEIPENVTTIKNDAFEDCYKLDVVINNSKDNVKVKEGAFDTCKSVKWLKE